MHLRFIYSPVHNVLGACISIIRTSGRGLGPGIREFFGPCEMASSRYVGHRFRGRLTADTRWQITAGVIDTVLGGHVIRKPRNYVVITRFRNYA
jgi:hypothetical protein